MKNEIYIQQIIRYFRSNFIESHTATEEDLTEVIREKLVLLEDREDRKDLISRSLEEIQELILIYKYQKIYNSKNHTLATLPKWSKNIIQHLNYSFRRNLYS